MKCKLCIEREATKTNSHLITWALIKEAINQPGFKQRGYDVTFALSSFDTPSVHIGRSVLPSHIEEVLGYPMSDDAIKESPDPFSRNHIFCPQCEDAISKLESEFIDKVYNKLKALQADTLSIDGKGNGKFALSDYETKLTYLLAYSLFFRTSLVKLNNISLSKKMEETMRATLLSLLSADHNQLKDNIDKMQIGVLKYPVAFCYLETIPDSDSSENLIIQNQSNTPYFLLANRVIFQLYSKAAHIKSSIEHFYGFSHMVDVKEYVYPLADMHMTVCILPNEKRKLLNTNLLQHLAEVNMENAKILFRHAYKKLYKKSATAQQTGQFAYYYSIIVTDKMYENIHEPFIAAFKKTLNLSDK